MLQCVNFSFFSVMLDLYVDEGGDSLMLCRLIGRIFLMEGRCWLILKIWSHRLKDGLRIPIGQVELLGTSKLSSTRSIIQIFFFFRSGNNAIIFINGSTTLNGSQIPKDINNNGVFNHPYDPDEPLDLKNLDATIDNAFYVMNVMHDFSYRYGFQESAGNFQADNLGRGKGRSRDPVQVSIHDFTGVNNAQFSTPPE